MTDKSLRAGRRIGIMAATAVVGIVGFGPLAGHAFAATPTHSTAAGTVQSANETGQPPSNGWQQNGLRLRIGAPGLGVTADVPLCNPSNGWQC